MTSKSCRAEIRIGKLAPAAAADIIYSALAPDVHKLAEKGERTAFSRTGSSLVFKIETGDIASLRANVNSFLRLVDASYRCIGSAASAAKTTAKAKDRAAERK
ncbi:KEOPS complex subunit Pcc1 [Nitrososphaera sp.]|uniref:KEOPS complex subunit Pcc1 n=1 Tax=Nitrososphaera sp. TaxID=1971748 RepID=UPI00307DFE1B